MAPTEREKLLLSNIPDLDTGSSNKVAVKPINRSVSLNFAAVLRPATCVAKGRENEDAIEEKFNSDELEKDEVDGSQYSLYEEQEDISCLCGVDISSKSPEFYFNNSDLNSVEQNSVTKSISKTWKSTGKGQKRKKAKSANKKKLHKRQKVDVLKSAVHQNVTTNKITKMTGGGSHKTSTKGSCVTAKQQPAQAANGGVCCLHLQQQRGGGGGEGDDGDGKPPKKPLEEGKCGGSVGKAKPKKKNQKKKGVSHDDESRTETTSLSVLSGEDKEQPDMNNTRTNDSMVVDEQNERSGPRRDVEMVSEGVQQRTIPQVEPEQPRPQVQEVEISWQLKVVINVRINHHTFCETRPCLRCHRVETMMHHFFDEMHGTCKCHDCQLWLHVLNYHTPICKYKDVCHVCKKASTIAQEHAAPEPRVDAEEIDFPTCRESLDHNEQVVWKNPDVRGLTHFKEDRDYIFEENSFVGKGGHGIVRKVAIPDNVKKKHFSSTSEEFVMKRAAKVEEDEKYVFEQTLNHPNFVQTHLVIRKMEPELHYLILMEKCDMSIKDYLSQLVAKGEKMKIEQAMFYWTQVLDAIKYLHFLKIGVIHKDVKAGNVLLTIKDNLVRVKLADFDAVKQLHNAYTKPGLGAKGTLGLTSPEVLRQESHGRPADVWNMAMFLLQLLFPEEFSRIQKEMQPSKGEGLRMFIPRCEFLTQKFLAIAIPELKKIDYDLGEVIERCLSEEPSDRPTANQVLEDPAVVKYIRKKIDMEELIGQISPDRKQ